MLNSKRKKNVKKKERSDRSETSGIKETNKRPEAGRGQAIDQRRNDG